MKKIKNLEELKALIDEKGTLYIRYSANINGDCKRGYSTNHANGQSEMGLSVENLVNPDGIFDYHDSEYLAMQVSSYGYLGEQAYILTGDYVGRGSDNEPMIEYAAVVAQMSTAALDAARQIERARIDRRMAS